MQFRKASRRCAGYWASRLDLLNKNPPRPVAIIGGGPAGLMAAEALVHGGAEVDVYDSMPSVGRKFLLAGKGGLNLTHSEPLEPFLARYGERRDAIAPLLQAFGPESLIAWVGDLGFDVFVGSSGRVFPKDMKAAPLLRAWLHRLRGAGVRFHLRHRWRGWNEEGLLRFATPQGDVNKLAAATILAAGGGSWPQLGSDGAWIPLLAGRGVPVIALRPSNSGFDVAVLKKEGTRAENAGWSDHFRSRFAGQPLKPVAVSFTDHNGVVFRRQGEFVVTKSGIEGSLIYALSASLREEIAATGGAMIYLDLLPDRDLRRVIGEVAHPRGARSMSSHLQSRTGLKGVKTALLRELVPAADFANPERLAGAIKSLPLRLVAPRPLEEAISTAGGVPFEALDENLMIRALPGVFCAGEMVDWEAPTGGYLLTACFATGRAAGLGALDWLKENRKAAALE
jgi:uncharacterized flavoprotein (TIGR03862 family)